MSDSTFSFLSRLSKAGHKRKSQSPRHRVKATIKVPQKLNKVDKKISAVRLKMCLKDLIFVCVFLIANRINVIKSYGLDDKFRSGCVFNFFGEDFLSQNSTFSGNVSAEIVKGRDCVLIFRDLPKGKLGLTFRSAKIEQKFNSKKRKEGKEESTEEMQQSCGTSFVKIYDVDSSDESLGSHGSIHSLDEVDNDKRKRKVGHFCNRMLKDREISINFNSRLEVILVQSKFDVFYEFNSSQESDYNANAYVPPRWIEDSNKTSNKELSSMTTFRPLFLEKSECERQLKFACKYSVVCGVAASKFLCNKTKHLCIELDNICNDVSDCLEGDNSDESRCSFPLIKNISFVLMTVGICSASTVCCLNHKASLRKNNVVRYKGDVIKRKDIIKAKKQGGFISAVDTTHLSERKTSLMLNNPSLTPVDTEEKNFPPPSITSTKGFQNSSEDLVPVESKTKILKLEPLTILSVNNLVNNSVEKDPIKVTDNNGTPSSAKILYDYSLSDDEDLMEGKHGGYGYRFEFQNCR